LRGYLSGSLDLVVRLNGAEGQPRFLVVDYKTNWLAPEGEALSAWHYRPAALGAEMQSAHYPLQALLYMVALHRYLRWRLPGYDPQTSLAGVLYLFVRGMVGPGTPVAGDAPSGVFAWRTPPALVTDLSNLLHHGTQRA
jgi:exodeoxyribonuclease V beta subunit